MPTEFAAGLGVGIREIGIKAKSKKFEDPEGRRHHCLEGGTWRSRLVIIRKRDSVLDMASFMWLLLLYRYIQSVVE